MHEVIARNKECNVSLSGPLWDHVSPEGRDLVSRMVAKSPEERISAKEALAHPWFTSEDINTSMLSSAYENMKKYSSDENRFNVGRIKPEFSMVTCSPLLSRRPATSRAASPLLLPGVSLREESKQLVSFALGNPNARQE